jgi:outer membrane biosynthesis protein TonB
MGEVTQSTYKKARAAGYLGSGGSGLILFLVLFFSYIITPIPPYPEGGGGGGMDIEVNLGYEDYGLGMVQQPDLTMPDFSEQKAPQVSPVEEKPEEIIAQDQEETATVTTQTKTPKKKTPKVSAQQPQKEVAETPKPVVEKPKTVNKSALYKPTSNVGSTSQGNTKGAGDQGDPDGLQSSAVYGKGGKGGSGPGSGGGTGGGVGKGIGDGIGDGVGPGVSFSLTGRSMILMKKPEFTIQKEGIVVVEITVDKTGKVISATPGKQGSTVTDKVLYEAAKKAALESKFNLKNDAPDFQVGKITYHFKLE